MIIGVFFIMFFGVAGFVVLIVVFSASYKNQRIKLEALLAPKVVMRIENVRAYGQEEHGKRNGFPSVMGWERVTLDVGEDFILVKRYSTIAVFPNAELQPFVIALSPDPLKQMLNYNRIYKPHNVKMTDYGRDLSITIKAVEGLLDIDVIIHLTFEKIAKVQREQLLQMATWGNVIRQ